MSLVRSQEMRTLDGDKEMNYINRFYVSAGPDVVTIEFSIRTRSETEHQQTFKVAGVAMSRTDAEELAQLLRACLDGKPAEQKKH